MALLRGKGGVVKVTTQRSQPGFDFGRFDPESTALTIGPLRLPRLFIS